MNILSGEFDGLRLGWDSPAGAVVHPRHVDLKRGAGTGWLDGFSEFIARCGLCNIGSPGWDSFTNIDGERVREHLTLHGEVANTAAERVSVRACGSDGIAVTGSVFARTTAEVGLELVTEIATWPNARRFRIVDVVTNHGRHPTELQLLYHCNFGPPLLAEGARFLAPIECLAGFKEYPGHHLAAFDRFSGPRRGFREQVFVCWLRANSRGKTCVALQDPTGNTAVSMTFSLAELPCMTLWKQTGTASERYVTGLEPGTSFPNHRSFERQQGRLNRLAPGSSHASTLDFTVHTGAADVARLRARIAAMQGKRSPRIIPAVLFYARGRHLRPAW